MQQEYRDILEYIILGGKGRMGIQEYLQEATEKGASDLFIIAGLPLLIRLTERWSESENG